ncbi:MAG TPA: hypothetical protein VMB02_09670 [Candidatus Aquilonibacter sp.]|nr:hypothetical protein [Candidatus Aquilonibacter sp.]
MKNYRIALGIAGFALALLFAARPAASQVTTSTPVIVKQTPPKSVWLKAEVVHQDGHSITVREQGNQLALHTFTYAADIQDAMQQISEAGGYQFGDKVRILYKQGQTVALRIKGRPSLQ